MDSKVRFLANCVDLEGRIFVSPVGCSGRNEYTISHVLGSIPDKVPTKKSSPRTVPAREPNIAVSA